jgi:hypothetical protein
VSSDDILHTVTDYFERVHKITHLTIQVEKDRLIN